MIRRISSKLKRTAASLLAAALILAALPLSGLSAQAYAADQSGSVGTDLVWEIEQGVLTIKPAAEGGSGTIGKNANGKYNVAAAAAAWPWYEYRGSISYVKVEEGVSLEDSNTEPRGMFGQMTNLIEADLSGFDLSQGSVFNDMFNGCSSLKTVIINGIGRAAQWNRIFNGCSNLENLAITNSGLKDIGQDTNAFNGVTGLKTVDLSGSSLSGKAVNIFSGQSLIESVDLSGATVDTTIAAGLLSGCPNLNYLKLTDTSGAGEMLSSLSSKTFLKSVDFKGSGGTSTIDVSGAPVGLKLLFDGTQKITLLGGEWTFSGAAGTQRKLSSDDVLALLEDGVLPEGSLVKTGASKEGNGTFGTVSWEVRDGKLTIWPTNNVSGDLPSASAAVEWPWDSLRPYITEVEVKGRVNAGSYMIDMFAECPALESADLKGLDISGSANISGLFQNCSSLKTLAPEFYPASSSSVNTVNRIFKGCLGLEDLDLSKMAIHLRGLSQENSLDGLKSLKTLNVTGVLGSIAINASSVPALETIINNGPRSVYFNQSKNPFTIMSTWMVNQNGSIKLVEYSELLTDRTKLEPGTYSKYLNTVAGFENLKDCFYVIKEIGDYRLEINGQYYDSKTGESTLTTDATSTGYFIEKSGSKIDVYSQTLNRSEWETIDTYNKENEPGHSYDKVADAPDVKITFYDAAIDANGDRHDVYIDIDKFTIYNPVWVQHLGSLNEYKRYFLTIDKGELIFRNWVKKSDLTGNGNRGSGTYTDARVSIEGAKKNQSFLFYVDDLDVARRLPEDTSKSVYGYPGAEGIELGEGFDLSSATVADKTWIRSYTYTEDDGYMIKTYSYVDGQTQIDQLSDAGYNQVSTGAAVLFVGYDPTSGSPGDSSTYRTTLFAAGDARGSSFTWQSGVNCDTWFLKGGDILSVWDGHRPVSVKFESEKLINNAPADSEYDDLFSFSLELVKAVVDRDGTMVTLTGSSLAGLPLGATARNSLSSVSFGTLAFDRIGRYEYTVSEDAGDEEGIIYTDETHTLVVEVSGATDDYDMYMGLKAEVYLDGTKILTTHSTSTVNYSTAKDSNQISLQELRNAAWKWVDASDPLDVKAYTYTYDFEKGLFVRSDGAELSEPPANAQAEFFPVKTVDSGSFNNGTIQLYFPVTVKKTVSGNMGDKTKAFSFEISFEDGEGNPFVPARIPPGASGADGTYSFTLSHGEEIVFEDIKVGTKYTVTETDYSGEGYTTSLNGDVKRAETGTIEGAKTLSFENSKPGVIPVGLRSGAAASSLLLAAGLAGLLLALTRRRIRG